MPIQWKPGDKARFEPSKLTGSQMGFAGDKEALVSIPDLFKEIDVRVIAVDGDNADIAIDGGEFDGATAKADTKDLIPIP
jgi:hypothetical protein